MTESQAQTASTQGPNVKKQEGPDAAKAPDSTWFFSGWGFIAAVLFGWGIEFLYGYVVEPDLRSGVRTFTLLWFASGAAFFAGTIGGFLFGVPKFVANPAALSPPARRFNFNTNLEDISDWFTKIILGLSLVHVDKVIRFVDSMGKQVADAIGNPQGAKIIAISAMIYGAVCGFHYIYIWTSTALREYFEEIEGAPLHDSAGKSGTP